MAQRFGGQFSPNGSKTGNKSPLAAHAPRRAGARTNWLFIAPLPLLIWIITAILGGNVTTFAVKLSALGLFFLAAWLTREGEAAHEAYDARMIARRPAIPRKLFGAVALGLALTLAAFDQNIFGAAVFGVFGTALHLFSFGLDPMSNKGGSDVDEFQQDRVAKAVDEAERILADMKLSVHPLGDRAINSRVDQFQASARQLFRRVEEDPRDLTTAKKFLSVYLKGARDAAQKFASLYSVNRDATARAEFETLLDDLEDNFEAKTDTLLANNKSDLDIEMKVLRDRLAREGLTLQK